MESTYWQELDEASSDEASYDEMELEELDESDEGDEGEDVEAVGMRRPFPGRGLQPVGGVRFARVVTPNGTAKLELPTAVAPAKAVGRVRRQLRASQGEIEKLRKVVRRLERQNTFGANLGIVANVIGQLKETFMDVYVARRIAAANGVDKRPPAQPTTTTQPVTP